MTPGACLLELRDLVVERGGRRVLDVPSFRLAEGELVALIGPNGSGKSTLLLSAMGLVERSAGLVLHRGREVPAGAAGLQTRRKLAMVLQEPLLFDATVENNVAAGLRLRGVGRAETRRRVAAYLDRFHLAHLADRPARRLSGGEARRVSLARALVVEPEVVFLDEPFANLDLPTRQAITDDLERTVRAAGIATVLVTHDPAEALRLADRVVVMHGGEVIQSDTPAAVLNHPVNEYVAGCVGMETVVEGVVRERAGWQLVVSAGGQEIHAVGEAAPGDAVHLCVRPENVVIEVADPSGRSSARNVYAAHVEGVARVGPYLKLELSCGFPLVAYVTRESYAGLGLSAGRAVYASFKATAVHVIRRSATPATAAASPAPPRSAPASRGAA